MPRPKTVVAMLVAGSLGTAAWVGGNMVLGIHTVQAKSTVESHDVDYARWGTLLRAITTGGGVSYDKLTEERDLLNDIAGSLESHGPKTTPQAYPDEPSRLAYYINAYNVLTLLGVMAHWPVNSVQDVHGLVEPVAGFGFFWAQHFKLDGRRINLYDLENDILRKFGDARMHAAINCASTSCPTLEGEAFVAEGLNERLNTAARALASESRHVEVHQTLKRIELSSIYQWFEADFVEHAAEIGVGDSVLDWIAHYATPEAALAIRSAKSLGYELVYKEYDWSLNSR